jgi:hypothetical protein
MAHQEHPDLLLTIILVKITNAETARQLVEIVTLRPTGVIVILQVIINPEPIPGLHIIPTGQAQANQQETVLHPLKVIVE